MRFSLSDGLAPIKSFLLPALRIYHGAVWGLFRLFFTIAFNPRKVERPSSVRSVLHISVLSHKPFMLSRKMRERGIKSEYMAVSAESGWLKLGERGYDYNVKVGPLYAIYGPFLIMRYLWKILREYDVIHYHFGSVLTREGRELPFLKEMGKLIVFHYRGCDLRQKSVNMRLNPDLNCCKECDYPDGACENEIQRKRLDLARKYGDLFFVTTPDLLDFMPEAEHIPFIAPVGVDMDAITPVERDRSLFRVVTSSNHDGVDGTAHVRDAVERLKAEGHRIELVEVRKAPYEKALAVYKSADVYAGKLLMGCYNNANIECMMMGVPCMSYVRREYMEGLFAGAPIIVSRPDNIYDRLREYIGKRGELAAIGARGKEYVKRMHNPDKIVDMIIARYNNALSKRDAKTATPA